jgi:hypothetical protein
MLLFPFSFFLFLPVFLMDHVIFLLALFFVFSCFLSFIFHTLRLAFIVLPLVHILVLLRGLPLPGTPHLSVIPVLLFPSLYKFPETPDVPPPPNSSELVFLPFFLHAHRKSTLRMSGYQNCLVFWRLGVHSWQRWPVIPKGFRGFP